MKLTKFQFKLLKFYAKYETTPLTLFCIVGSFWIRWLLLLLVAGGGLWYMWAGWPALGWIFVGVSIGAFLRDWSRILSVFLTWPAIREILDWQRLRELIESHEKQA